MKTDVSIQIPRLHAEAIADLIHKTPREEIAQFVDYDVLEEFTEAVEHAVRLERAVYGCGLRQFGMMTVHSKQTETFDITPRIALELACFMEQYKRIHS